MTPRQEFMTAKNTKTETREPKNQLGLTARMVTRLSNFLGRFIRRRE